VVAAVAVEAVEGEEEGEDHNILHLRK